MGAREFKILPFIDELKAGTQNDKIFAFTTVTQNVTIITS